MRSRHSPPARGRARRRITSACAEQTLGLVGDCSHDSGSPPRVRSRLPGKATAEADGLDHLRVCGADVLQRGTRLFRSGSPPRVRSRRHHLLRPQPPRRITSACAEQTTFLLGQSAHLGDHLRVCGADPQRGGHQHHRKGSPPRVRSRRKRLIALGVYRRITSACAEQTDTLGLTAAELEDHLRVCGADSCILLCSEPAEWCGIFDLRTA